LAYASRARGVPAEGRAMALEQPIAEIEQEWLNRGPLFQAVNRSFPLH